MRSFTILFLVVIAVTFAFGSLEEDKEWASYKVRENIINLFISMSIIYH